jgi:phosphoribosyl 1,2-cyclic phosphate phosphodiesterase
MEDLRRIFSFAFGALSLVPGYVRPEPHLIDGPFQLGEVTLTPFPLKHGRAQVNGYLMESGGRKLAAYLSDCKEVPAAAIERIHGVEALVIDALRYAEHPTHLSVRSRRSSSRAPHGLRTFAMISAMPRRRRNCPPGRGSRMTG